MRPISRIVASCLFLSAASFSSADEVFRDPGFEGGFNLSALTSTSKPVDLGVMLQGKPGVKNEWRLAQWGTQFDLKEAPVKVLPDGTRIVRNAGKSVKIYPSGLNGEGIVLGVNGGAEYGGKLRKEGQFWPHLLLEQQIPKDFRLADLQSLNFAVDFRVEKCKKAIEGALDPALHTAHTTAYWTLSNHNPASPDRGNMIWFGVPLFDARQDVPPGHQAEDTAVEKGKFICTIEGSRFFQTPTGDGQWHTVSCDLIPLMKEALAAAQEKGFLKNTKFDDLYATSFNIGWEVPGPYDCEIALKHLSLDKVAK